MKVVIWATSSKLQSKFSQNQLLSQPLLLVTVEHLIQPTKILSIFVDRQIVELKNIVKDLENFKNQQETFSITPTLNLPINQTLVMAKFL